MKTTEQVLAEANAQVVEQIDGQPVTRGELNAAFALVENKENWKLPIDALVTIQDRNRPRREIELIRKAVVFFTGSVPTIDRGVRGGTIRVKAAGYYNAVGA